MRWRLTQAALSGRDVRLQVKYSASDSASERSVLLPLSQLPAADADAQLFRKIGILGPWTQAVIGDVMPGGAAEKAGLRHGDVVLRIGNQPIVDGQQLRETIRASVGVQDWQILRGGQALRLVVTPDIKLDGGQSVGRIGAYVGAAPAMLTVRYGPLDGLWNGVVRTWDVSVLTLKMMGKMVIGEASLKNLSEPDDCRLRREMGQPRLECLFAVSGIDQREPGCAEFTAAAGFGWWAPDVLSLGSDNRQKRV